MSEEEKYRNIQYNLVWLFKQLTENHEDSEDDEE